MADSREEHGGGQAPMLCQICEIARGIEWKCLDCDLLMCPKCKEKIHPKFKLANEHKIVNIKDVGHKEVQVSSFEGEMRFGDIKCTEHSEENSCLYCKLCDKLICMQCVIKTHKSHIFEEIKCGYLIKKDNLMKHTKTLKIQQETLTNEIEKLEKGKEDNNLQFREVKNGITTHEKVLKEEVENYTLSLINELDEKMGVLQQGTENDIARVKTMKVKIQEKLTKAEEFINIKDGTKFFQNIEGIEKSLKEDVQLTTLEKETLPTFVPGKLDLCSFGILKSNNGTPDEEGNPYAVKLKIGREYIACIPEVTRALCSRDGHIWIWSGTGQNGILQKVKPTENTLKIISRYEIVVHGMTLNFRNDICVCTNDKRIKCIDNGTGKIKNSKYDVGQFLIPVAIFMKNNFTWVGAIGSKYPENGQRVVIKMNKQGYHVHTAEFLENKLPIFTFPLSLICTNDEQNVFVIDGLSHDLFSAFRLVILLGRGGVEYYKGHSSINNSFDKIFCPTAIQAAPSNNIILDDCHTSTLHILNPHGQLSAYMNFKDIGIPNGYFLGCSSKQLFIGHGTDEDENQENMMAKLYELNMEESSYLV